MGSSPLARGLRFDSPEEAIKYRIIPARAGFTEEYLLPRRHLRDHPRSRGVYAAIDVNALAALGSSPLARGLRDPVTRFR